VERATYPGGVHPPEHKRTAEVEIGSGSSFIREEVLAMQRLVRLVPVVPSASLRVVGVPLSEGAAPV